MVFFESCSASLKRPSFSRTAARESYTVTVGLVDRVMAYDPQALVER